MDKNVVSVALFLIFVFAITAVAHFNFVAHDAEMPAGAHGSAHGDSHKTEHGKDH